jgi:hypothetical protein
MDLGYYASRTVLGRLGADATSVILERGLAGLSAPGISRLIAEIATRFSAVVSERAAASSLPVLGALGGATINLVFMNHFQRVADAHFTVRRLERQYGAQLVRNIYTALEVPERVAVRT